MSDPRASEEGRIAAFKEAGTSALSALASFVKTGGSMLQTIANSAAVIADVTNTVTKTMELVEKRKDAKTIEMVNGAIPIVNDVARIANNASKSIEQTGPVVDAMSETIKHLSDTAKSLKTVVFGSRAKIVSDPKSQGTSSTPPQSKAPEEEAAITQRPRR